MSIDHVLEPFLFVLSANIRKCTLHYLVGNKEVALPAPREQHFYVSWSSLLIPWQALGCLSAETEVEQCGTWTDAPMGCSCCRLQLSCATVPVPRESHPLSQRLQIGISGWVVWFVHLFCWVCSISYFGTQPGEIRTVSGATTPVCVQWRCLEDKGSWAVCFISGVG